MGSTFLKYLKVLKHTTKEMGSKKKVTVFSKDKRETNEVVGMLPGPTLRVDFTCTTIPTKP